MQNFYKGAQNLYLCNTTIDIINNMVFFLINGEKIKKYNSALIKRYKNNINNNWLGQYILNFKYNETHNKQEMFEKH